MIQAFFTGFFLGFSLILAIGAQNAFVLRQGIIGQHVFFVALFCAISDTILIVSGITSISFFLKSYIYDFQNILFGLSAIWLMVYGALKLRDAFKSKEIIQIESSSSKGLFGTITILAVLTFANPHVYLDTVILIGSISQQFSGNYKIAFAIGASLSSFIFFFSLAYGARLLLPIMRKSSSWRILDIVMASIMFIIAIKLAHEGSWI
jgi:L-lysine exporter family protein LysE/ArgO